MHWPRGCPPPRFLACHNCAVRCLKASQAAGRSSGGSPAGSESPVALRPTFAGGLPFAPLPPYCLLLPFLDMSFGRNPKDFTDLATPEGHYQSAVASCTHSAPSRSRQTSTFVYSQARPSPFSQRPHSLVGSTGDDPSASSCISDALCRRDRCSGSASRRFFRARRRTNEWNTGRAGIHSGRRDRSLTRRRRRTALYSAHDSGP